MAALSLCVSGIIWCVATADWNNVLSLFLNNLCLIPNTCSGKHKFWPLHFWRLSYAMPFCFFQLELYMKQNNKLLDFYFLSFVNLKTWITSWAGSYASFMRRDFPPLLSPGEFLHLFDIDAKFSCHWKTDKCMKEILVAPSYIAMVWGRSTCYSNTVLSLFIIYP